MWELQCSAKVQHGKDGALRIMISGAPASGKGTQCELIVQQVQPPPSILFACSVSMANWNWAQLVNGRWA